MKIRKRLPQFVQGLLPAADARDIADHLHACTQCHEQMADIQKVWAALSELPTPEVSSNMFSRVLEQIDAYEQKSAGVRWEWLSLFRPTFAAAAVTIMLIGFVSGAFISSLYTADSARDQAADDPAYSEILPDAPQASFFDIYLQTYGENNRENSL